ncbi:hypothetical protein FISHEDRAFT_57763 [Fistulina hepatica ATCC 64428]|uniref:Uncharacterized protein n=1 Tax=Fistulina hepatica ATCC 64428 TaxID=1128425 RepID=A0A0D7AI93_9AGAR|nr:hypothetical protein FISHEDRAFT_57763 [Fistulina hepatica ATCC 64428]
MVLHAQIDAYFNMRGEFVYQENPSIGPKQFVFKKALERFLGPPRLLETALTIVYAIRGESYLWMFNPRFHLPGSDDDTSALVFTLAPWLDDSHPNAHNHTDGVRALDWIFAWDASVVGTLAADFLTRFLQQRLNKRHSLGNYTMALPRHLYAGRCTLDPERSLKLSSTKKRPTTYRWYSTVLLENTSLMNNPLRMAIIPAHKFQIILPGPEPSNSVVRHDQVSSQTRCSHPYILFYEGWKPPCYLPPPELSTSVFAYVIPTISSVIGMS